MILQKWLTTNSRGTAKLTHTRPRMGADDVAIFLEIEIPDALFDKPHLMASIKVPQSAVPSKEITAEVTDNIEEAIKTVTGLEMRVSIATPPEDQSV